MSRPPGQTAHRVAIVRILAVLLAIDAFGLAESGGRVFAREFALYVNFSAIAIVLWTGEAGPRARAA